MFFLIIKSIRILKTGFENFFEIIDRFYAIEVASRIQVAKQEVLKDRTETVNEMTRLTVRIDDDVKKALRILKDALTKIYRIINKYSDKVEMEMSMVQETADCIKSSYDQLMFSKTTLADTLKNFSVYSERFLSLLDASEGDILRLGMLVKVISEVKDELADVQARAETLKREVLIIADISILVRESKIWLNGEISSLHVVRFRRIYLNAQLMSPNLSLELNG